MRKNSSLCLLVLLLFSTAGCQEVVHFDSGQDVQRIVINSILKAGSERISLQVSLTHPVTDTAWLRIENAEAALYENGREVGKFQADSSGWYSISQQVHSSYTYRIDVKVPGYGRAWGETTVPAPIQAGRIEIFPPSASYGSVDVDLYWTDDPGHRNFYWIGGAYSTMYPWMTPPAMDTSTLYLHNTYDTRSTLPDPFNRVTDEIGDIPTSYEYLIRIEDSGLAGSALHLPYRSGSGAGKYKAFLLSTDRHYDAYLKSSILNRENMDTFEDLPLYYEPAYTYSNIQGGTGLVASYTSIEKLYLPDYETPSDFSFIPPVSE